MSSSTDQLQREDNINIRGYPENDMNQFSPVCHKPKLDIRGQYTYFLTPDLLLELLVPVYRGKTKQVGCPLWVYSVEKLGY